MTTHDNSLEQFSSIFSFTDMKSKDMTSVIMGKEILQIHLTEVNKKLWVENLPVLNIGISRQLFP